MTKKSAKEWAEHFGVSVTTIRERIDKAKVKPIKQVMSDKSHRMMFFFTEEDMKEAMSDKYGRRYGKVSEEDKQRKKDLKLDNMTYAPGELYGMEPISEWLKMSNIKIDSEYLELKDKLRSYKKINTIVYKAADAIDFLEEENNKLECEIKSLKKLYGIVNV